MTQYLRQSHVRAISLISWRAENVEIIDDAMSCCDAYRTVKMTQSVRGSSTEITPSIVHEIDRTIYEFPTSMN